LTIHLAHMTTLLKKLWDSPIGIRTTHFWGPAANWGIVLAGLSDINRPVEKISVNMSSAMLLYSALFMRFALRVQPRNLLLFACHAANESVQLYHWTRAVKYNYIDNRGAVTPQKQIVEPATQTPPVEKSVEKN